MDSISAKPPAADQEDSTYPQRKNTLKRIISATKSATLTRSKSTNKPQGDSKSDKMSISDKGSISGHSMQPPEKEIVQIERFVDMLDLLERASGRTMDNQSFTPKKPEPVQEEQVDDEDDDVRLLASIFFP